MVLCSRSQAIAFSPPPKCLLLQIASLKNGSVTGCWRLFEQLAGTDGLEIPHPAPGIIQPPLYLACPHSSISLVLSLPSLLSFISCL
jgi:hypothetical protein